MLENLIRNYIPDPRDFVDPKGDKLEQFEDESRRVWSEVTGRDTPEVEFLCKADHPSDNSGSAFFDYIRNFVVVEISGQAKPEREGVHELEHVYQYREFTGYSEPTDLEAARYSGIISNPDNLGDGEIEEKLTGLGKTLKRKGYSMSAVANLLEEDQNELCGKLSKLNKRYTTGEDEAVKEALSILEKHTEEGQTLRFRANLMHAECESFAHFLDVFIQAREDGEVPAEKDFDSLTGYPGSIPDLDGRKVGEYIRDRVDDLTETYGNLVEHGEFDELEAARYVLQEVQTARMRYTISRLENPEAEL